MAVDKTFRLEHGDLVQVWRLTKLLRLGPEGKGFSYDYVKRVLDEHDPRKNADIEAIAHDLVARRERSMAALLEAQAQRQAKKQARRSRPTRQ